MEPKIKSFVEALSLFLAESSSRLTWDTDTHATDLSVLSDGHRARYESDPNYYHGRPVSAEDLIREMDMSGIDGSLVWLNPGAMAYTEDQDGNAERLIAANRYILDSALLHRMRFVPGGWTDPRACGVENAMRVAEICVREFGFLFVKMNPAQNRYPIDGEDVMQVVDRIVSLGAIPTFHFGADTQYTPAEGLERILARHPDHPFLAVHMGGGGASYPGAEALYQKARRLGLERPNLRFALSAKRDTHMESDIITYQLAGEPFCSNLFCASDAPYGRMSWNFGGFRAMLETLMDSRRHPDGRIRSNPGLFTPQRAQGLLGGNFARFAAEGYARLNAAHEASQPLCR